MNVLAATISERFPPLTDLESIIWPAVILAAFVATAAVVDVMVILAARWKMIDLPNTRSAHALPTARGGGAAIMLVMISGTVLAAFIAVFCVQGQAVHFSIGTFYLELSNAVVTAGLLMGLALGVLGAIPPAIRCLAAPLPQTLRS